MKEFYTKVVVVSTAAFSAFITGASAFAATTIDPTKLDTFTGKGPTLGGGAQTNLVDLVTNGINLFLGLLGLIAVIVILIGGFKWMTASSAEEAKKARGQLIQGLMGLVVILLAWSIAFGVINIVTQNLTKSS